tara:strand:- start:53 stop:343 length:291 start_codon:yes stop_codon:yes gene_type:complete
MTKYIYENGIEREATTEEEAARDIEEQQWSDGALDRALNSLRQKRNHLLKETDWTSNSDVTMSSDMTTYRQALRDITNELDTVEQVEAVVFPTKPV